MVRFTYLGSTLSFAALACSSLTSSPSNGSTYEYIVIGSGPGGGPLAANLARAGHSVLLLEAGSDESANPNVTSTSKAYNAINDPSTRWDFFVKHSSNQTREDEYKFLTWRKTDGSFYVGLDPPAGAEKLGIYYPRSGTLGGCAMHNAAITLLPFNEYWDDIANITNDPSWRADQMSQYFTRIENNTQFPRSTPGHGYDGWLTTSAKNQSYIANNNTDLATIALSLTYAYGETGVSPAELAKQMSFDINNSTNPDRDTEQGFFNMVYHASPSGQRSSPAYFVLETLKEGSYPLTLQLESFVTKILFEEASTTNNGKPRAKGVEVVESKSFYSADPRSTCGSATEAVQYFASKEVIVSGGVFNTPQLLKLSGIGPKAELEKFNIPVVADLPGVGANMDDNYESSVLVLANNATHNLTTPPVPTSFVLLLNSKSAPNDLLNVMMYCSISSFEGFFPGMPVNYGPSEYECGFDMIRPKSRSGTVELQSADPRDVPLINLNFFKQNGNQDLTEMLDAVRIARTAFISEGSPLNPWRELHPCPGLDAVCSDLDVKEELRTQAFSHHATSSCKIGATDDPMAVLDGSFRVRGVDGLRVVDASAHPRVPGAFPVLPTMMLSEKATDVILAAAAAACS